ncbi:hypothetical protein C8J56DRAFT_717536, partial [Mycena floridula]
DIFGVDRETTVFAKRMDAAEDTVDVFIPTPSIPPALDDAIVVSIDEMLGLLMELNDGENKEFEAHRLGPPNISS